MECYLIRVVLCWSCGLLLTVNDCNSAERDSAEFEIVVAKLKPATPESKHLIQEWLLDLESTPLIVHRLAVVMTGEFFTGGKIMQCETVHAKQFAIAWATQAGTKDQRVIFRDESLLDPVTRNHAGQRYVHATANALDQLRQDDNFFEARGPSRYSVSKKPRLTNHLKLSSVFYPIAATTATVTEWYRGSAANPVSARVEIERLVGFYQQGNKYIAEFYYQSTETAVLHRFVVFEGGVPVQVEDRMAMSAGDGFRMPSLLNLEPADLEQMQRTREESFPVARTRAKWKEILADLQVPVEIQSKTINGPHSIEAAAQCVWLVNEEVKPLVFDPKSVGNMTPLELID